MPEIVSLHPVLAALIVIGAFTLCSCALLLLAGDPQADTGADALTENILRHLPQTQCGQCGHPGCRPYAEAIAAGEPINRCPPGGSATIARLSDLLNVPALPLDPLHGVEKPREVAFIREDECIGCVKCIAACPVDAILGASGQMHTVIAAECTGCDLCVEPCPVDCIEMRVPPEPSVVRAPFSPPAVECIRCARCEDACPVSLLPQQLYWYAGAGEHAVLERHGLSSCIECGACASVCPSRIPLVEVFRDAKQQLGARDREQQRAQTARRRFEARQQRRHEAGQLARTRRGERERARAGARAALVEAAVERVRTRKLRAPGMQTGEVAAAVERARRKAIQRAGTATAPANVAPSSENLQRLIATTERKLQRAHHKHDAARAAADPETAALLAEAITRLDARLAKAREDLDRLREAGA